MFFFFLFSQAKRTIIKLININNAKNNKTTVTQNTQVFSSIHCANPLFLLFVLLPLKLIYLNPFTKFSLLLFEYLYY